jgi:hypothetical protein
VLWLKVTAARHSATVNTLNNFSSLRHQLGLPSLYNLMEWHTHTHTHTQMVSNLHGLLYHGYNNSNNSVRTVVQKDQHRLKDVPSLNATNDGVVIFISSFTFYQSDVDCNYEITRFQKMNIAYSSDVRRVRAHNMTHPMHGPALDLRPVDQDILHPSPVDTVTIDMSAANRDILDVCGKPRYCRYVCGKHSYSRYVCGKPRHSRYVYCNPIYSRYMCGQTR